MKQRKSFAVLVGLLVPTVVLAQQSRERPVDLRVVVREQQATIIDLAERVAELEKRVKVLEATIAGPKPGEPKRTDKQRMEVEKAKHGGRLAVGMTFDEADEVMKTGFTPLEGRMDLRGRYHKGQLVSESGNLKTYKWYSLDSDTSFVVGHFRNGVLVEWNQ